VRKQYDLGNGDLEWVSELSGPTWLAYRNGPILVFSNFQGDPIALPKGEILVTTQHDLTIEGVLEHDQTVWLIPE
jgi:alpha-glucosidase